MNYYLGTSLCVCCGKNAVFHCGHVIAKEKMALGNFRDRKVLAGWCSDECHDKLKADVNGSFGKYNNVVHGPVKDCYEEMFVKK